MAGKFSFPVLWSAPSARLVPEVAPDGPGGEFALPGEEAGDLLGIKNPNVFEIGVVLEEPQGPVGAEDRQPLNMLVVNFKRMVGNPHPCIFPLGKCDKSATFGHPPKPNLIVHGEHTSFG